MNCPACGIGPEYQAPAPKGFDQGKSKCSGCGTIFFDSGSR